MLNDKHEIKGRSLTIEIDLLLHQVDEVLGTGELDGEKDKCSNGGHLNPVLPKEEKDFPKRSRM